MSAGIVNNLTREQRLRLVLELEGPVDDARFNAFVEELKALVKKHGAVVTGQTREQKQ